MYQYLRRLLDFSDYIGTVEDINWYHVGKIEVMSISGTAKTGKKFELRLETKEKTDGT